MIVGNDRVDFASDICAVIAARNEVCGRHQEDHSMVSRQQGLVAGDHFWRVSELLSENEQKWIKFTGAPGLTVRL